MRHLLFLVHYYQCNKNLKKIVALTLFVVVFSSYGLQESSGTLALKKSDEIRCTNIYPNFLKLGESGFHKRYPSYPIMDKCMNLFQDSKFVEKHNLTQKDSLVPQVQPSAEILSALKIGQERYLIKFNLCREELKTNYVLIISDKEQIVGKDYRSSAQTCPSFWIVINANNPSEIRFSWDYEHKSNKKEERKMF